MTRLFILLTLLLSGCASRQKSFRCDRDDECVFQGQPGICEPSGACSFPDPACPDSGRRYGEFSAPGPICVGAEGRPFVLSVSVDGAGTGRVVSDPPGIDCQGACSAAAEFAPGTIVTLSATNNEPARRIHFDADCTGAVSPCEIAMTAPREVRVLLDGNNYMFIARSVVLLDNGLLGPGFPSVLDGICQNGANDADGNPILPGTFHAWVATSADPATARLSGARGWIRPDGRPFADRASDLVSAAKIFYPPRLDIDGGDVGALNLSMLTGAQGSGAVGANCADWSNSGGQVTIGSPTSAGTRWTSAGSVGCSGNPFRVYCFGVDLDTAARPATRPAGARLAFVTATEHAVTGGLAQADEHCQADADAAGLGRTFRALLGGASTSAASRFNLDGPPWYRLDDVRLLPRASELASTQLVFEAPLNVDERGVYGSSGFVWNGAPNVGSAGSDGSCADFTSTTGQGIAGQQVSSTPFGGVTVPCGHKAKLYCFEE